MMHDLKAGKPRSAAQKRASRRAHGVNLAITLVFPALIAVLTTLFLASCAGRGDDFPTARRAFLPSENTRRIAVVEFENLTANPRAGSDLSLHCYNELFRRIHAGGFADRDGRRFDVAGEAEVRAVQAARPGMSFPPREFAAATNCQLVLFGTVSEYQYKRGLSENPAIGLHLRLYDAGAETVIWSGSLARAGRFSWFGEDALGRLAGEVCRDLLGRLAEDVGGPSAGGKGVSQSGNGSRP